MRTAFIGELIAQARINPKIILIVGDLGYSVVEPFAREFPDRFINAGVAEQNMTGMAAGLASEGYHVFTYSIANFPTFRCAEQIRNDIAYHKLPVTVVAVGGGLTYGSLGYSHHAVQDIGLMRLFPGILIAAPGDPVETRACVQWLSGNPQPSYLRIGKAGEKVVHPGQQAAVPGQFLTVRRGPAASDALLLTTGGVLADAVAAATGLTARQWDVASLPLWCDECRDRVARQLQLYREVITVEDHIRCGGFSAYIEDCIANAGLSLVLKSITVDNAVFGQAASEKALRRTAGIDSESILARLRNGDVARLTPS